jgi:hypothetical protein
MTGNGERISALRAVTKGAEPSLLTSLLEYNLIEFDGLFYGIPHGLAYDWNDPNASAQPGVHVEDSAQKVMRKIRSRSHRHTAKPTASASLPYKGSGPVGAIDHVPVLLDTIEDYNIVSYEGFIYGLPHALGSVDLEDTDVIELEGVIRDVSRSVVENEIRDLVAVRRSRAGMSAGAEFLDTLEGYNIVRYGGYIYGLPQSLGALDLADPTVIERKGVIRDVSRLVVENEIYERSAEAAPPQLLGSLETYNIIGYEGFFYGVPQALGSFDLATADIDALTGIIREASREAVEREIQAVRARRPWWRKIRGALRSGPAVPPGQDNQDEPMGKPPVGAAPDGRASWPRVQPRQ